MLLFVSYCITYLDGLRGFMCQEGRCEDRGMHCRHDSCKGLWISVWWRGGTCLLVILDSMWSCQHLVVILVRPVSYFKSLRLPGDKSVIAKISKMWSFLQQEQKVYSLTKECLFTPWFSDSYFFLLSQIIHSSSLDLWNFFSCFI